MRGRLAEGMGKSRAKSSKPCRFRGNPCKSERPLSGLETCNFFFLNFSLCGLAKVNDRLAVWRLLYVHGLFPINPTCKSERPLSGLETSFCFFSNCSMFAYACKSERPLSGLETRPIEPQPAYLSPCKSERPLSGLETLGHLH